MLRPTLFVALCSAALSAQSIVYSHNLVGPERGIATGGDLDGDGVPDYAIRYSGAPGGVALISGRNGTLFRDVRSAGGDGLGRFMAMLADFDGDNASDLLFGAPDDATRGTGSGAVHVLSGRQARRVVSFFGVSAGDGLGPCAGLADVDNDGTADYVIAAPGSDFPASDAGVAYVISGRTHVVLRTHVGIGGQALGEHLLAIEDQDRDGVRDYAVSTRAVGGGHQLEVFGARSGVRLFTVALPSSALALVREVGDVDNDGRADVGAGFPAEGANGRIHVLSGAGFAVLLSYAGTAGNQVGETLAGVGDLNGDRRGDLALGRGAPSAPRIVVISGSNGADLADLGVASGAAGIAAAGDLNRDGRSELVVSPFASSRAAALSTNVLALTTDTQVTPVATARQVFSIDFGSAAAGSTYLLLGSFAGTSPGLQFGSVNVPLNLDPMLLYTLSAPNTPPYTASLGTLNAQGRAQATFGTLRVPAELLDVTMHHAVIVISGNQIARASNAVPLTFIDPAGRAPRAVTENFASNAQFDRARSGGLTFGTFGSVGGTGLLGDFDHRLGLDLGGGVFEFDLQRDTRLGVRGFAIPASRTLTGTELFVSDGLFHFATMDIPAGITVRFKGPYAARFVVRGHVRIAGTLDVSASSLPQHSSAIPGSGQAGGEPGCGGGRGGNGADTHDGTGAPRNGENGQDVRVLAGHAYSGLVAGTGGRGALQFPAGGNAAVTHTLSNLCMQLPAGGGGGGYVTAGAAGVAVLTPSNLPADLAPNTPAGSAFQLFPLPPNTTSSLHFLVGGAGGGGGCSHAFYHQLSRPYIWKSGAGGTGGGGVLAIRAGWDVESTTAGNLLARGGDPFNNYQNLIQGPPGPGGSGAGGSVLVQSEVGVRLNGLLDVRGGRGMEIQPGLTQLLNFRTRGGAGSPGFYRVESPNNVVSNANPPVVPDNLSTTMSETDAQSGQQSLFYVTGAPFAARFVRYEIEAVVNGVPTVFSDTGNIARFGTAARVWFKLQGAEFDQNGALIAGSEGLWRDTAAELNSDGVNGFRFVVLRSQTNVTITRIRVFVAD